MERIFSISGTTSRVSVESGASDGFHLSSTDNLRAKQRCKSILTELDKVRFKKLVDNTGADNCHSFETRVGNAEENALENILKPKSIARPRNNRPKGWGKFATR